LEELFRSAETVCHILESRGETSGIPLERLQESALRLFKKAKLTEKVFAQFLTVSPNSFNVKWSTTKSVDLIVERTTKDGTNRTKTFRENLQNFALQHHEVLFQYFIHINLNVIKT
jgi:hypothetical protein